VIGLIAFTSILTFMLGMFTLAKRVQLRNATAEERKERFTVFLDFNLPEQSARNHDEITKKLRHNKKAFVVLSVYVGVLCLLAVSFLFMDFLMGMLPVGEKVMRIVGILSFAAIFFISDLARVEAKTLEKWYLDSSGKL